MSTMYWQLSVCATFAVICNKIQNQLLKDSYSINSIAVLVLCILQKTGKAFNAIIYIYPVFFFPGVEEYN
jgi:hypothetical protein